MPVAPDRLLRILDSLDYHIAIYDRDWRYTYVNAEAARVLGRRQEELLGHCIWDLFPEAVGNQYYRELHEAAASGRPIHSDHYYAPFREWFENHIYPLPDGVLVLSRDITQARENEAMLRRRDAMLRLAQRAGGVATFEWDLERQVAHCSAEFFRIFGLPEEEGEMSSSDWAAFVHPDDRDRMAEHLEGALRGGEPAAADYRIVAADGRERWLSYSGQLRNTSEGHRMVGTVVDITDRKSAEARLRESRDVLALAMRGGSMGAWSRNLLTNEVWWSPELEEIVGLPPGGFEGTETGFFDLVHEEDRAAVRAAVDGALERRSDYVVEFRFRHAAGEWRWMEGRGRAVYDEDGTARTLYGVGIDIAARKQAEAALAAARDAAEAANRLKDQFLATLSHELRTPLNAILGYARMLATDAVPPDKRRRAIEVIERNAVAQQQLVDELLDMSRIAAGKVRIEPELVAVAAFVQQAVEAVRPDADAKGVTLRVEVDRGAGTVRADVARLQQVVGNLLNNAVKFTDRGGGVTVSVRRTDETVDVSVTDTGVGLSPDFLPFVFQPFRQADAQFGRQHGGLGLGLAISRQLVELHGGTIQVSSAGLGHGSTFTVRLPTVPADEPGPALALERMSDFDRFRAPRPISLHGLDVLLVDDQEDTLSLFRLVLERAGARVRTATCAAEAIRHATARPPDVLVSDLGLPGMDGYDLLRTLREIGRDGKQFPAIAVSAYARRDDRARAIAAGFQAHLAKPVDPESLVRVLTTLT